MTDQAPQQTSHWPGELDEFWNALRNRWGGPPAWTPRGWGRRALLTEREWAPATDMFDLEQEIIIEMDMPGIGQESMDISVHEGVLTVHAERKRDESLPEQSFFCCERRYGHFYRAIQLPTDILTDKIDATYQDGVLRLVLPKKPEVAPRKVQITIKE